tara:strand:+ start:154 stop:489 length:336 start_codon:yes stop_codon:yes gene_type:complete
MAQVGYFQIDENNIIIAFHNEAPEPEFLPANHTVVQKTVEAPAGLLGLSSAEIDLEPDKRSLVGRPTEKEVSYSKLLAMSNELDLLTRLGEDTTDLQADFDAEAVIWRGLP